MSRRSTRSSRSNARVGWLVVAVLACGAVAHPASAQSGRNRSRPPAPQPRPQPAQPAAPGSAPEPIEPAAPPPTPVPPGGLVAQQSNGGPVTRYVLRNGLTIVVRENPAAALAAVVLAVRDDAPGAPDGVGAAAARAAALAPRPGGAVAARMRALGAALDVDAAGGGAATFSAVVPADAAAAAVEASAPLLEPPAAPAPAPAAGTAAAEDPVAAFVRERYRPDRAVLAVAGNVIPYNVLVAAQRAYGALGEPQPATAAPPKPAAPPPPAAEPAGPGYALARADSGLAVVTVAYRVPAGAAEEGPALDLAAAALADGWGSRLGRALRWTGLAARVSSRYEWRAEGGELAVEIAADPQKLDAAEAALFREVDRFRRERVSEGELQRARNVFERRFLARRETVEGEARELARFEREFGEVRAAARYLERVRAVTAADLQRAAARYLSAARANVGELLPPDAPARTFTAKTYAETVAAWAPSSSREVAPSEVRAAEGPPAVAEGRERHRQAENEDAVILPVPLPARDFSTLNGPKAFVREDQSRSLVSIGLFYPAGRAAEAAADRGVTELMLRSMLRGSRRYPGERLMLALEQLGGEARVVDEPDFFGVVVEGLSRNAEQLFPVAIDLVERPTFEKEDVAREREVLLADQRVERADARARAAELFWQSRFPAHPYGAPALGVPETVAKLTEERVREWYARAVRTQFPLVGIVGDTDGSSLVSRFVADGFDRPEGEGVPSPGLPAPAPPGGAIEERARAGTVEAVGFPAPGGAGAVLDALDVAAAAAGARAAAELSDAPPGAARVDVSVERRRLAGAALVTASSPAGDETRVREVVLARFADVAAAPLTDADLAAARAAALRMRLGQRESFTGLLLDYVRTAAFGATLDSLETYADRVRATTADAVRKAAAVFNPQLLGRGVVRGRP